MTAALIDYDEAVKRWAASKVGFDWTEVEKVTFSYHTETCGEGTCDWEVPDVQVLLKPKSGVSRWASKQEFDVDDMTFAELVREVASIADAGARVDEGHQETLRAEAEAARKDREQMRTELQKVIGTVRALHRDFGSRIEWLGQGVE